MYQMLVLASLALSMTACTTHAEPNTADAKLPDLGAGTHLESISVPDVGQVNYAIRVDDSYDSTKPAPLVLVLHHGYQGPKPKAYTGAGMLEKFKGSVQEIGGIAIAPDVVGSDWRHTSNEQSAVWLVQSAMKTYNIDATQVYVIGFSMGGAGTWHIAGGHQDLFTAAIPVAAPVTGTTQWKIPVYAIHSEQDEIVSYSAAKKHATSIKADGGTIQFITVNGLTHFNISSYDSYVIEGVKWLRAQ